MIENKIFKIILATIFISNFIFNSFASDEIIIRGKGGTIKSKSGGIIKIKAGFNMMKIEKFKETFKSYNFQNKNETIINDQIKKIPDPGPDIILRGGPASKIYRDLKQSVFFIINPTAYEDITSKEIIKGSTGSGSLISSKGLIITNYHVTENANQLWLYPYSKNFNLKKSEKFLSAVIVRNKTTDLAILKTYAIPNEIKPIQFGDINKMNEGDDVYAIGHPDSLHWSITDGIISNIRTNYSIKKFSLKADLIQNTAPILGGSSGGPLLNEKGEIIGVNTIGDNTANFNFAVSVKHISELLNSMPDEIEPIETINEELLSKKFNTVIPGDYNNNGVTDEWSVDTNDNGIIDAVYVDDNEDGKIEVIYIDKNENQKWDMIVFDDDLDGNPNRQVIDEDEDGKPDVIAYDFNQDGEWDKFKLLEKDKS